MKPHRSAKARRLVVPNVSDVVRAVKAGEYDLIDLDELFSVVKAARDPLLRAKLDSTDYPPPKGYYKEATTLGELTDLVRETVRGALHRKDV